MLRFFAHTDDVDQSLESCFPLRIDGFRLSLSLFSVILSKSICVRFHSEEGYGSRGTSGVRICSSM